MKTSLKAEFLKLFTVRSTYLLTLLVWLAIAIIAFYGVGYHDTALQLQNPLVTQDSIFGSLRFAGLIVAIISILLLAHEYRYNTINFSFTLNRSRSKVLAAKFIVLTVYAIVLSLVSVGIVVGCLHAGAAAHGHTISLQSYSV
ncbi:MAG: ABC transporter permease, partial [Candidatus Saccharimonadales bacterium]